MTTRFESRDVARKFDDYAPNVRKAMLALRELVFETADATPGVAGVEETLKWGEPAYVTVNKAGTTVRMDWKPKDPEHYALYFHCQTGLVEMFRDLFPDDFAFEGNRAVKLRLGQPVPKDAVRTCIAAALTYHLNKRRARRSSRTGRRAGQIVRG